MSGRVTSVVCESVLQRLRHVVVALSAAVAGDAAATKRELAVVSADIVRCRHGGTTVVRDDPVDSAAGRSWRSVHR